ncbi:MAG: TetR/AcrR family transcriptional regulator [Pseudomonadota bacterium]
MARDSTDALPAAPGKGTRKEALAGLAIEMLQSRGFSALGLRELAEAAGMRPPSLYSHFHSKDELGRAALALYAERHRAGLAALADSATGAGRIRTYAMRCGQCLQEEGQFCLFLMLTTSSHELSPEAVREIAGFVEEQMEWLATGWDQGRTEGSIRSDQPGSVMGPVVFGALRGLMAFAVLKPDPVAAFSAQRDSLLAALGVT